MVLGDSLPDAQEAVAGGLRAGGARVLPAARRVGCVPLASRAAPRGFALLCAAPVGIVVGLRRDSIDSRAVRRAAHRREFRSEERLVRRPADALHARQEALLRRAAPRVRGRLRALSAQMDQSEHQTVCFSFFSFNCWVLEMVCEIDYLGQIVYSKLSLKVAFIFLR